MSLNVDPAEYNPVAARLACGECGAVRNRIDAASTEAARETEQILARFRPSSGQTPVAALRGGAEGAEAAG